jgi:hypothetical protein
VRFPLTLLRGTESNRQVYKLCREVVLRFRPSKENLFASTKSFESCKKKPTIFWLDPVSLRSLEIEGGIAGEREKEAYLKDLRARLGVGFN